MDIHETRAAVKELASRMAPHLTSVSALEVAQVLFQQLELQVIDLTRVGQTDRRSLAQNPSFRNSLLAKLHKLLAAMRLEEELCRKQIVTLNDPAARARPQLARAFLNFFLMPTTKQAKPTAPRPKPAANTGEKKKSVKLTLKLSAQPDAGGAPGAGTAAPAAVTAPAPPPVPPPVAIKRQASGPALQIVDDEVEEEEEMGAGHLAQLPSSPVANKAWEKAKQTQTKRKKEEETFARTKEARRKKEIPDRQRLQREMEEERQREIEAENERRRRALHQKEDKSMDDLAAAMSIFAPAASPPPAVMPQSMDDEEGMYNPDEDIMLDLDALS